MPFERKVMRSGLGVLLLAAAFLCWAWFGGLWSAVVVGSYDQPARSYLLFSIVPGSFAFALTIGGAYALGLDRRGNTRVWSGMTAVAGLTFAVAALLG